MAVIHTITAATVINAGDIIEELVIASYNGSSSSSTAGIYTAEFILNGVGSWTAPSFNSEAATYALNVNPIINWIGSAETSEAGIYEASTTVPGTAFFAGEATSTVLGGYTASGSGAAAYNGSSSSSEPYVIGTSGSGLGSYEGSTSVFSPSVFIAYEGIPPNIVASFEPHGNTVLAFEVNDPAYTVDPDTGNYVQTLDKLYYLAAGRIEAPMWTPEFGVDNTIFMYRGRLLYPPELDPRIVTGAQAETTINGIKGRFELKFDLDNFHTSVDHYTIKQPILGTFRVVGGHG